MFAVIILGIGFIMVAAIFPVAIQQSKLTVDESTAAGIGRMGANFVEQVATEAILPPTDLYTNDVASAPVPAPPGPYGTLAPAQSWTFPGKVVSFRDPRITDVTSPGPGVPDYYRSNMWNAVRGNLVLSSDTRYAWVPLYKRDRTFRNDTTGALAINSPNVIKLADPAAQLILIPVQIQNRTTYDARDTSINPAQPPGSNTPTLYNLQPRPMIANIPAQDIAGAAPGTIALTDPTAGSPMLGALAEGTFVVISDDNLRGFTTPPPGITPADLAQADGKLNGHVYRLGARRTDLDQYNGGPGAPAQVWEFTPGAEFNSEMVHIPGNDLQDGTPDDKNFAVAGLTNAVVFVIGRGFTNPTLPPTAPDGFEGAAQDISSYVTFVKVRAN